MTMAVLDFHDDGGVILIPGDIQIDMHRLECSGESSAYDTSGKAILIEKDVPLNRLEDSFGASPRRTLNRIFAKIEEPSKRRVNVQNLSRYFWMTVAMNILQKN